MATRSIINVGVGVPQGAAVAQTAATIYKHYDGYPQGIVELLDGGFKAIASQTADTRATDPTYFAAKLLVYIAGTCGKDVGNPLNFLGVGITAPGEEHGQDYEYFLDCQDIEIDGFPRLYAREAPFGEEQPEWEMVPRAKWAAIIAR